MTTNENKNTKETISPQPMMASKLGPQTPSTPKPEFKTGQIVHAKFEGGAAGSLGKQVGTIDHLDSEYIKLNKNDSSDGNHHWIPLNWVEKSDVKAVYLNKTQEEFKRDRLNQLPFSETFNKAV